MKGKILTTILFLIFTPLVGFAASFDHDLYYGISGDPDVTRLQEFLREQKIYAGPVTGNFLNLTLEGVKKFQDREGIIPVAGYFGPKTRARANVLLGHLISPVSQDAVIEDLLFKIKALQAEIQALQAQGTIQLTPSLPISAPEPLPLPKPAPAPLPAPKPAVLEVLGGGEQFFPASSLPSFKLGDFTLKNGTARDILFAQIILKIKDEMNSPLNRGKEVILVLRDGTTTFDEEISRKKFTFNSNAPEPGNPHRYETGISYPVLVKAGMEKNLSIWIDSLEYVISGRLEFELKELQASTSLSPVGGFKFVFTR